MIHLQIISRNDNDLQTLIRTAIAEGSIKSFEILQIKGGLKLGHKKHLGEIRLTRTLGPVLATLVCKNRAKEWQLLEAFVGRLVYHFKDQIASMNIQLEPDR